MSAVKQGAGMSKAAQRKRKSLNKSLFAASVAGANQSDDESSDVSPKKAKKSHKIKNEETESKNVNVDDSQLDGIDLADVSLTNILDMKEVVDINSKDRASLLLRRIIAPTSLSEFYGTMWEKRPVYIEHSKKYFADIINSNEVEEILSNHLLLESEDIAFSDSRGLLDIHGQPKEDAEPEEEGEEEQEKDEVNYDMIKAKLARAQTVHFLTPQKYHDGMWRLLSALEHEFDCMVGANVVMAPPNSTSNPRQYDSSDNFILQLRGSSVWSLWAPAKGQELPRTPGNAATASGTGDDKNDASGDKKADEKANYTHTLNAGDVLYVPKGWHYVQSNSDPKIRSMTLKLFTNQGHAAVDLLDVLLPQAVHEAAQDHVSFRRGLPRDLRSFLGVIVSEDEALTSRRETFQAQVRKLLETVVEVAVDVLDPAADQLTKKLLAERLPVPLTPEEEQCTSSGLPNVEIHDYTKLRMVRPGIASVFVEDGKCVVYHCMHNSRELFGNPLQPLEFELDDGPALEGLLRAYPEGVTVSELEHPSEELEDKIGVAQALFKEGFLMIDDEFTKSVLGISSGAGGDKNNEDGDDDEDSIF